MKTIAIISEYNPLHNGHLYHIRQAMLEKPDTLVCVMSGNFTQRGDIAVTDKHTRAKHAVMAGADIVIELPAVYAVNCAEIFAEGACKTLSVFDGVTLSFGSESGDLKQLKTVSDIINSQNEKNRKLIKKSLDSGESYATARLKGLPEDLIKTASQPNNILAIEYIKSAEKYGFELHTVKRKGDYNSDDLNGGYASATAIRTVLENSNTDILKNHMPDYSLKSLKSPVFNDAISDMILYKIATIADCDLSNIYGISEGLENRIKACAFKSKNYSELINNIKTKRYTMARIKRILLYILFNLTVTQAKSLLNSPPYARVLALKKGREDILSALSNNTDNLIIKSSDINNIQPFAKSSVLFDELTARVYGVASKTEPQFNCIFVK